MPEWISKETEGQKEGRLAQGQATSRSRAGARAEALSNLNFHTWEADELTHLALAGFDVAPDGIC